MSPRAAWRLETLGFENVHDYVAGKADWMAHGLSVAGDVADQPRVIDHVRDDVITCRLDDKIADVRQRVAECRYGFAFVTTAEGVLLGRLRKAALEGPSDLTASEVMEPGPSTTRPNTAPTELLARLQKADLTTAVLTDPEGRLLGIVRRSDLDST